MNTAIDANNEQLASDAFSAQSHVFDDLYGTDTMIAYKRLRVRNHIHRHIHPGATMLELNAGTGEDALYFTSLGHNVHATDISTGMIHRLSQKAVSQPGLTYEVCSYLDLDKLCDKGPYDHIFSNFAGLNCTAELDKVLDSFSDLLKPGSLVTLVILPRFCLWETLLIMKGKFRTAFRRFFSARGRKAIVENNSFTCWYYDPSYICKHLAGSFALVQLEGLCTIVPPSYIVGFPDKYPRLFKTLSSLEEKYAFSWPWKSIGDYYIITLRKLTAQ